MLYAYETWSLTLREEYRLGVFVNRTLRRTSAPKRNKNAKSRKLHIAEIYSLYLSPNIVRVITSRRLRWIGRVARINGTRAFKNVTGKHTVQE